MNKTEFETYVSLRKKIMKLAQKYFDEAILPQILADREIRRRLFTLTDEDKTMTDVWRATKTNVTVANELNEGHDVPAKYFYDAKFRKSVKTDKEKAAEKLKKQMEKEAAEEFDKRQEGNKKQLRSLMLQYPDEVKAITKLTTIKNEP